MSRKRRRSDDGVPTAPPLNPTWKDVNVPYEILQVKEKGKIFRAKSRFADKDFGDKYSNLSLHIYDVAAATRLARNLHQFQHPNIVRHRFTNQVAPNSCVVGLQDGSYSVEEWMSQEGLEIWQYSDDNEPPRVLGMGKDFISFFRGLSQGLNRLHSRKVPYGKLQQDGVRVSCDGVVMLSALDSNMRGLSVVDRDNLLKRDINDFKNLVKNVIQLHQPRDGLAPAPALSYFYTLCDEIPAKRGYELWNFAYFATENALFFDGLSRYYFLLATWDFIGYNHTHFFDEFGLVKNNAELELLYSKVEPYPELKRIRDNKRFKKLYRKLRYGFIVFLNHCYWHIRDKVVGKWYFSDTENLLNHAFPDLIPSMFYKLTRLSKNSKNVFGCGVKEHFQYWMESIEAVTMYNEEEEEEEGEEEKKKGGGGGGGGEENTGPLGDSE